MRTAWLYQGPIGNWIYDIFKWLSIPAVGLLVGYVKERGGAIVDPLVYGLVGAAAMATLIAQIQNLVGTRSREAPVNAENIEPYIRTWLDHFHLSSAKVNETKCHFLYAIHTKAGVKFAVGRLREFDNYITIFWNWAIPAAEQEKLRALTPAQMKVLRSDLQTAIASANFAFSMNNPLSKLTIERRVPITDTLNEDEFIRGVNAIEVGAYMVLSKVAVVIDQDAIGGSRSPVGNTVSNPPGQA